MLNHFLFSDQSSWGNYQQNNNSLQVDDVTTTATVMCSSMSKEENLLYSKHPGEESSTLHYNHSTTSRLTNPRCYNCHEIGHVLQDCPKPRMTICYNCHQEGHKTFQCTSGKKCHVCEEAGHIAKDCPNLGPAIAPIIKPLSSAAKTQAIRRDGNHDFLETNTKPTTGKSGTAPPVVTVTSGGITINPYQGNHGSNTNCSTNSRLLLPTSLDTKSQRSKSQQHHGQQQRQSNLFCHPLGSTTGLNQTNDTAGEGISVITDIQNEYETYHRKLKASTTPSQHYELLSSDHEYKSLDINSEIHRAAVIKKRATPKHNNDIHALPIGKTKTRTKREFNTASENHHHNRYGLVSLRTPQQSTASMGMHNDTSDLLIPSSSSSGKTSSQQLTKTKSYSNKGINMNIVNNNGITTTTTHEPSQNFDDCSNHSSPDSIKYMKNDHHYHHCGRSKTTYPSSFSSLKLKTALMQDDKNPIFDFKQHNQRNINYKNTFVNHNCQVGIDNNTGNQQLNQPPNFMRELLLPFEVPQQDHHKSNPINNNFTTENNQKMPYFKFSSSDAEASVVKKASILDGNNNTKRWLPQQQQQLLSIGGSGQKNSLLTSAPTGPATSILSATPPLFPTILPNMATNSNNTNGASSSSHQSTDIPHIATTTTTTTTLTNLVLPHHHPSIACSCCTWCFGGPWCICGCAQCIARASKNYSQTSLESLNDDPLLSSAAAPNVAMCNNNNSLYHHPEQTDQKQPLLNIATTATDAINTSLSCNHLPLTTAAAAVHSTATASSSTICTSTNGLQQQQQPSQNFYSLFPVATPTTSTLLSFPSIWDTFCATINTPSIETNVDTQHQQKQLHPSGKIMMQQQQPSHQTSFLPVSSTTTTVSSAAPYLHNNSNSMTNLQLNHQQQQQKEQQDQEQFQRQNREASNETNSCLSVPNGTEEKCRTNSKHLENKYSRSNNGSNNNNNTFLKKQRSLSVGPTTPTIPIESTMEWNNLDDNNNNNNNSTNMSLITSSVPRLPNRQTSYTTTVSTEKFNTEILQESTLRYTLENGLHENSAAGLLFPSMIMTQKFTSMERPSNLSTRNRRAASHDGGIRCGYDTTLSCPVRRSSFLSEASCSESNDSNHLYTKSCSYSSQDCDECPPTNNNKTTLIQRQLPYTTGMETLSVATPSSITTQRELPCSPSLLSSKEITGINKTDLGDNEDDTQILQKNDNDYHQSKDFKNTTTIITDDCCFALNKTENRITYSNDDVLCQSVNHHSDNNNNKYIFTAVEKKNNDDDQISVSLNSTPSLFTSSSLLFKNQQQQQQQEPQILQTLKVSDNNNVMANKIDRVFSEQNNQKINNVSVAPLIVKQESNTLETNRNKQTLENDMDLFLNNCKCNNNFLQASCCFDLNNHPSTCIKQCKHSDNNDYHYYHHHHHRHHHHSISDTVPATRHDDNNNNNNYCFNEHNMFYSNHMPYDVPQQQLQLEYDDKNNHHHLTPPSIVHNILPQHNRNCTTTSLIPNVTTTNHSYNINPAHHHHHYYLVPLQYLKLPHYCGQHHHETLFLSTSPTTNTTDSTTGYNNNNNNNNLFYQKHQPPLLQDIYKVETTPNENTQQTIKHSIPVVPFKSCLATTSYMYPQIRHGPLWLYYINNQRCPLVSSQNMPENYCKMFPSLSPVSSSLQMNTENAMYDLTPQYTVHCRDQTPSPPLTSSATTTATVADSSNRQQQHDITKSCDHFGHHIASREYLAHGLNTLLNLLNSTCYLINSDTTHNLRSFCYKALKELNLIPSYSVMTSTIPRSPSPPSHRHNHKAANTREAINNNSSNMEDTINNNENHDHFKQQQQLYIPSESFSEYKQQQQHTKGLKIINPVDAITIQKKPLLLNKSLNVGECNTMNSSSIMDCNSSSNDKITEYKNIQTTVATNISSITREDMKNDNNHVHQHMPHNNYLIPTMEHNKSIMSNEELNLILNLGKAFNNTNKNTKDVCHCKNDTLARNNNNNNNAAFSILNSNAKEHQFFSKDNVITQCQSGLINSYNNFHDHTSDNNNNNNIIKTASSLTADTKLSAAEKRLPPISLKKPLRPGKSRCDCCYVCDLNAQMSHPECGCLCQNCLCCPTEFARTRRLKNKILLQKQEELLCYDQQKRDQIIVSSQEAYEDTENQNNITCHSTEDVSLCCPSKKLHSGTHSNQDSSSEIVLHNNNNAHDSYHRSNEAHIVGCCCESLNSNRYNSIKTTMNLNNTETVKRDNAIKSPFSFTSNSLNSEDQHNDDDDDDDTHNHRCCFNSRRHSSSNPRSCSTCKEKYRRRLSEMEPQMIFTDEEPSNNDTKKSFIRPSKSATSILHKTTTTQQDDNHKNYLTSMHSFCTTNSARRAMSFTGPRTSPVLHPSLSIATRPYCLSFHEDATAVIQCCCEDESCDNNTTPKNNTFINAIVNSSRKTNKQSLMPTGCYRRTTIDMVVPQMKRPYHVSTQHLQRQSIKNFSNLCVDILGNGESINNLLPSFKFNLDNNNLTLRHSMEYHCRMRPKRLITRFNSF